MGRKVYIEADDDTVLEKLRKGNLDNEVTAIAFKYPTSSISRDLSDVKEEKLIDKLCEGLELLKTNACIRDLSIDHYLRDDKEKEDAKRVERAYVTLGEYLTANASVQSLKFSINYLSDVGCSAVAEGIRSNHSVNNLDLGHDARDITPEGIDMLTKGIRDNNTISTLHIPWQLASALSHNNTLEIAHIHDWHGITEEGKKSLGEAILDNKTLKEITINVGGYDQYGREAGKILTEAVASNSSLRKFSIETSNLGIEAVTALAQVVVDNESITELSIYGKIGDIGAITLAEALKTNRTITSLNLAWNEIGDEGIIAIAEALKVNHAIRVNLKGNKIGDDGFKAIAEVLKVNHTVTLLENWLGIEGKKFSREGARALLEALKENNSLEELDLPNLKPDDEDAKVIAEVLQKNTGLKSLNVENGIFGDVGAVALRENNALKTLDIHFSYKFEIESAKSFAAALRSNNALESLDISCSISQAEGATAICEALEDNSSLRTLVMRACCLDADSARALAQSLRHNHTLRILNIGLNSAIGSEGAKAIAEVLKVNHSLYDLDLSHCGLGDEGGVAIGEALKNNSGLLGLKICDNQFRDRGISAIFQGIEMNNALRLLDVSSYSYRDKPANRFSDAGTRSLKNLLAANHSLAILDINDSYTPDSWYVSQLVSEIATGLRKNRTFAGLVRGYNLKFSASDKKELADAAIAGGSKNIIDIGADSDDGEWKEIRSINEKAADDLLEKIRKNPSELTKEDLRACEERLSAIFYQAVGLSFRLEDREEMAGILDILANRAEELSRQTALQRRRETNDRVRHDLSHYAEDNGLTFEQMCREIALYRTDQ